MSLSATLAEARRRRLGRRRSPVQSTGGSARRRKKLSKIKDKAYQMKMTERELCEDAAAVDLTVTEALQECGLSLKMPHTDILARSEYLYSDAETNHHPAVVVLSKNLI